MQRCGERLRIVALGGSVVGNPMKVRVSSQFSRAPVQPLRDWYGVDVGQHGVHGESVRCVIGEHIEMLLGRETRGLTRLRDQIEHQNPKGCRVDQRAGQIGNQQVG